MTENQTIKEKIIRERVQLLLHRPFFGHLTLGLELKELSPEELEALPPECRTMATDGKHLYYNPAFVSRLDPKVLQTILAHETMHCALGHLWRQEKRKQLKWNYATDYAINLMLKKEGFSIPANCLCDDKFDGMEAEVIYRKLPDQKPKGSLMDSHYKWPSDGKKGKNNKEQNPQNNGGTEEQRPQNNSGASDQPPQPTQSSSSGNDEQDKLAKDWKDKLIRAATAARMQGKLPGSVNQLIQDMLEPKLDWKVILRDLITSLTRNDFRLFPVSKKHLWRNIYLPSLYGEKLEIAVGIDTSGSVSAKEFQEFIAEIRGITEQFMDFTLYLFFSDAEIHDRITLSPNEEWPEQFPKKDGGTSFTPVINLVTEEYPQVSALVYLTDGAGSYPEYPPDYPVIWVLNTDTVLPWGQNIRMEVNDGVN